MKKFKLIIGLSLLIGFVNAQDPINNTGNIRVFSGAAITMFGDFTNSGVLVVENGATLTNEQIFTTTVASIANSGTFVYGSSAGLTYAGIVEQTTSAELPDVNGPPASIINNSSGVILSRDGIFNSLSFLLGNLTVGSNTLTINGIYARTSGSLVLNGNSNIIIGGTGANTSSLFFDQSNLGISNKLTNLTMNRAGQTTTLANALNVSGTVFPSLGILATGDSLTILSDVSVNGRIAALGASANITGKVTLQRFIPASARRYRFLSSPINGSTLEDWRGEIFVTGAGTGNTIGTTNSNGFDATLSNAPSVYYYTETLSGLLNQRWQSATATSNVLVQGKGYRVFVRGDRSSNGRLDGTIIAQNAVTLSSTGIINKGNVSPISLPVTYSGATVDDGWNMVGNPYPSQIDWNAGSGWTKTNVFGTIWIWNSATNSYGNWDGATATNSVTQYIASHQGFFVRTTAASPLLSCSELVKVSNTPAALFKAPVSNQIRIQLVQDALNSDETVIRFMAKKKDAYDELEDVKKLSNPTVNISSTFGNNLYASVNYLSENFENKIVPLGVWGNVAGTYTMNFSEIESFNHLAKIYLVDNFLHTQHDIITQSQYVFDITSDANSKGDNRFELQFLKAVTGIKEQPVLSTASIGIYPVPATDKLSVYLLSGRGEVCNWNLYGVNGKIQKSGQNVFSHNAHFDIDISDLNAGIYFIDFNGIHIHKIIKF
ncbi:MAG: T9SS type A sorting domain-containing protein [bacterium]|nr:T9SS type A sorting domain-containing protein [bacterium]